MPILIDECLPKKLKRELTEHTVFTVQEKGWTGMKNGELLHRAESEFDVWVTAEQQLVRAFRTDITKRVRLNTHEAVLHIELQLRDSTDKPMWARNAHYHGYLVGEHQMPVYSNVIYFHPDAGKNDPGYYAYSWNGYDYQLNYKVIRLIEIEGQSILEAQMLGLLPFTPLMKPP